jgi:hypothetical protein
MSGNGSVAAKRNGKSKKPAAKPVLETVERSIGKKTEIVSLTSLKPHPRNYRAHPDDQLEHIGESLKQHGFYRNVVIARDSTILAGHGVAEAARRIGITEVPVFRLDVDPNDPLALKVLVGDNELGRFAEVDDRMLTDLLKEIGEVDVAGLIGTGFDEKMLAALTFNTRPASEIATMDEAAEWLGMPEYDEGGPQIKLIVAFKTEEDLAAFVESQGMRIDKKVGLTWGTKWPFIEREDVAGIRFETGEEEASP